MIYLVPVVETGMIYFSVPIVIIAIIIFILTKKQRMEYQNNPGSCRMIVFFRKKDPGEEALIKSGLKEIATWRQIKPKYYYFYSDVNEIELSDEISKALQLDKKMFKVTSTRTLYMPR